MIQQCDSWYGGFLQWGIPGYHPRVDHFSIETHGDLGILYFRKPPDVTLFIRVLDLSNVQAFLCHFESVRYFFNAQFCAKRTDLAKTNTACMNLLCGALCSHEQWTNERNFARLNAIWKMCFSQILDSLSAMNLNASTWQKVPVFLQTAHCFQG